MIADGARRTILLVSDNGQGLGHVTRLMGIARRLPPELQPVLITLSEAHATVRDQGFPVEYFPSRGRLRLQKSRWSPLFTLRLLDAVERFRPAVLVVDHVAPAEAFAVVRDHHPDLHLVWSRRGLWRRGSNASAAAARAWFDHVLEPGDVAAASDEGATATDQDAVIRVTPITLLDRDELLTREEARRQLELPPTGPCVLVALSAEDADHLTALIGRVREVTDGVAADVHLFAPRHTLHAERLGDVPRVSMRPVYPLARYLRAFDLAITAGGYNTVHEVVRAGVPGIFVPKVTESVDDQQARARGAEARGLGSSVTDLDDPAFERAVRAALGTQPRPSDDEDVAVNGASAAADFLASLVTTMPAPRSPTGISAPDAATLEGAWTRFLSGWGRADRAVPRRALDVVDLSDAELRTLSRALVEEQREGTTAKTVLLVAAGSDVRHLTSRSIAYETCLDPRHVADLVPHLSADAYRQRRLASVAAVFGASEVRRLSAATDLTAGDAGADDTPSRRRVGLRFGRRQR